jgi:hypothetical protein
MSIPMGDHLTVGPVSTFRVLQVLIFAKQCPCSFLMFIPVSEAGVSRMIDF